MTCVNCKRELIFNNRSWLTATAAGGRFCSSSVNGKHEPEPTEAAPSKNCCCKVVNPRQVEDGECLICGKPYDEREAVVGGQPPIHTVGFKPLMPQPETPRPETHRQCKLAGWCKREDRHDSTCNDRKPCTCCPRPEMGKTQLFADFEKHYAAIPYKGGTKEVLFHDWMYEKLLEFYAAASGTESALRSALQKIANHDGGCGCDHTDADCCENPEVGEFCPHCIAEIALKAPPSSLTQAGPVRKPLPKGWWGWNAKGEPIEKCPYGPNGMESDIGL